MMHFIRIIHIICNLFITYTNFFLIEFYIIYHEFCIIDWIFASFFFLKDGFLTLHTSASLG